MLTIQTVENIKRGSRITLFNGLYALLIGILSLVFMKTILLMDFRRINVVWQVFAKYNPEISHFLTTLLIIKSITMIIMGIIIIYLSIFILKKKDKMAWAILFTVGILFWASFLTIDILNKNYYTIAASAIGWVMFVIGMIIPIKYYLEKNYEY